MKTKTEIEERLRGLEARQLGLSINTIIKRAAIAQTLRWVLSATKPEGDTGELVVTNDFSFIGELSPIHKEK